MTRNARVTGIAGGFVLAFAAAVFVASGAWRTGAAAADARASAGMTAFGDLFAAAGAFGCLAAVPGWFALRELRDAWRSRRARAGGRARSS